MSEEKVFIIAVSKGPAIIIKGMASILFLIFRSDSSEFPCLNIVLSCSKKRPMLILMIDNYDSFTYNLVQYFGELGVTLKVARNNNITLKEIEEIKPDKIVISPGPGTPDNAGISKEVIRCFGPKISILGVCLGHQCIGEVFGGKIERAKTVMHGKTSLIYHDGKGIYRGVKNPFVAARYHSLIIKKECLPPFLEVVAKTEDGTIMGIRHKEWYLEGVQFHPESFLTEEGKKLLKNSITI